MELLESQKSSFSIFSILKRLNRINQSINQSINQLINQSISQSISKIKLKKKHLKPPKLVSQSLFQQFNKSRTLFRFFTENLTLLLPLGGGGGGGANTDLPSNSNILKTVRVNIAFKNVF